MHNTTNPVLRSALACILALAALTFAARARAQPATPPPASGNELTSIASTLEDTADFVEFLRDNKVSCGATVSWRGRQVSVAEKMRETCGPWRQGEQLWNQDSKWLGPDGYKCGDAGTLPDQWGGYCTVCPAPYDATIGALRGDAASLRKMAGVLSCGNNIAAAEERQKEEAERQRQEQQRRQQQQEEQQRRAEARAQAQQAQAARQAQTNGQAPPPPPPVAKTREETREQRREEAREQYQQQAEEREAARERNAEQQEANAAAVGSAAAGAASANVGNGPMAGQFVFGATVGGFASYNKKAALDVGFDTRLQGFINFQCQENRWCDGALELRAHGSLDFLIGSAFVQDIRAGGRATLWYKGWGIFGELDHAWLIVKPPVTTAMENPKTTTTQYNEAAGGLCILMGDHFSKAAFGALCGGPAKPLDKSSVGGMAELFANMGVLDIEMKGWILPAQTGGVSAGSQVREQEIVINAAIGGRIPW